MSEFDRPLVEVTPHIKGKRVKDAQWLMQGHSRFPDLNTYKDGKIDGDYGPLSWNATARTKFWLGYPEPDCNHAFGQTLYEYLRPNDWRPLPAEYRKRREARLVMAVQTPGMKAFALAQTFLGYKETPVNRTMFGYWYGLNGEPWCAMFESYNFAHSGYSHFHYAGVEAIYWDMLAGRNGLRQVWTPRRGDVCLYSLGGDRFAHTAFFDHWIVEGKSFQDLGGNTGPVNVSNGGEVAYGVRYPSEVLAYVRVG